MPESPDTPPERSASPGIELPFIREFDDRGSLWLFEDPENLRGLLQILDPSLSDRLDFTRAARINRSFVPADLQEKESDLLYLVPFDEAESEVWVYVLLEHKSEPEPDVGLQLFLYMGQIWEAQRREWRDRQAAPAERKLRPIIPLVYYTGERRWSAPIGLAALMTRPPELERFVPRWETLYLPLREIPAEVLTRTASAIGWALRVWQAEQVPSAEFEQVLREALEELEGLDPGHVGQWVRVVWFLVLLVYHRREERGLIDAIIAEARESRFNQKARVAEMGLSVAQQLQAEGEARGRTEATRASLETFLTARFGLLPEAVRQAIAAADVETLSGWISRAATAATLAEVGIPVNGETA